MDCELNLGGSAPIDSRCKALPLGVGEIRCDLGSGYVAPPVKGEEHLDEKGETLLLWLSKRLQGAKPSSRGGESGPLEDGEEKEKFSNMVTVC